MRYAEIFQLRVRHTYFASGFCPALTLLPIGDTQKLLEGRRCLLKTQADRLVLLAELDELGQLRLSLEAGLKLEFGISVQDAQFFRYTRLPDPADGQVLFSTSGASILASNHFAMAQSLIPREPGNFWARAEITLANEITAPPQPGLLFDIELEALDAPWLVYLSTAQADEHLRIEGGEEGIYFHRTALQSLAGNQTDYDLVAGLDREETWSGSSLSGNGLDFAVSSAGLQSQGPANAAAIFAATPVAPVNGISWHFRLGMPFVPDADNRFELCLLARKPNPADPEQRCYLLQLGENSGNRLKLLRREPGSADQEIGLGSTLFSGPIDLEIALQWKDEEWTVEAGAPGQPKVEEIKITDSSLEPGGYLAFACQWDDPIRANQFAIQSLEIRVPLGSPADIERKKAVANTLEELFPDKNKYLFASAGPVTLKETPRKGISLKNGSSTLIEHMGNPSPDDNGTQFIHI